MDEKDKEFREKYGLDSEVEKDSKIIDFQIAAIEHKSKHEIGGVPYERYATPEEAGIKMAQELVKQRREEREARRAEEEQKLSNKIFRKIEKKLYALKGSAKKIKENLDNKKGKKMSTRAIAIVLSATALLSTAGIISQAGKAQDKSLDELIEEGANINKLGLSQESIDQVIELDSFFETADNKVVEREDLLQKAYDLYDLNLNAIKEKIGYTLGYPAEKVIVQYGFDNADGRQTSSVRVYENPDQRDTEKPIIAYSDIGAKILPIPDAQTLPKDICDAIWNLNTINEIVQNIQERKITDVNAFKQLKKSLNVLQKFASKELIKGKDNSLALLSYEDAEKRQEEIAKKADDREGR